MAHVRRALMRIPFTQSQRVIPLQAALPSAPFHVTIGVIEQGPAWFDCIPRVESAIRKFATASALLGEY